MDIVEMKTVLEGLSDGKGQEILDFYLSQVESEKLKGIQESSKKNKEAEGLRKFKMAFDQLGYDGQADLNEFTEKLKTVRESTVEKDLSLTELTSKLNKLTTDFTQTQQMLTAEKEASTQLKISAKNEKIKGILIDTLKDKVYGHDFISENLIQTGKIDLDNDKVVFIEKNGDEIVKTSFDDGINKLLESRPDIVKNVQRPGGGSTPPGPGGQNSDQDRLARLRSMGANF